VVPDPGPGKALVRIKACGVCHTDPHHREGGIGDDFPYLLGHEAAGVVDNRGLVATVMQPAHVPFDVGPGCSERVEVLVGTAADEGPKVRFGVQPGLAAAGITATVAVVSSGRRRSRFRFIAAPTLAVGSSVRTG
jgi:threonine dehydrogenase-like Zn-dependent dehydrogenase